MICPEEFLKLIPLEHREHVVVKYARLTPHQLQETAAILWESVLTGPLASKFRGQRTAVVHMADACEFGWIVVYRAAPGSRVVERGYEPFARNFIRRATDASTLIIRLRKGWVDLLVAEAALS